LSRFRLESAAKDFFTLRQPDLPQRDYSQTIPHNFQVDPGGIIACSLFEKRAIGI
jgi:hypothetical protein